MEVSLRLVVWLTCHLVGAAAAEMGVGVARGGNDEPPQVAYACEGNMLTIECPSGRLISVRSALFGRRSTTICGITNSGPSWNLDCMSTKAVKIITDSCDATNKCAVLSSVSTFGDPCPRTPKYLEVNFHCVPNITVTKSKPSTGTTTPFNPSTTSPMSTPLSTTRTPFDPWPSSADVAMTTSAHDSSLPVGEKKHRCRAQNVRDVQWPLTNGGHTATMPCPNNPHVVKAQWECGPDGQWVGRPNLLNCTSPSTDAIISKAIRARATPVTDTSVVIDVADDIIKRLSETMYGGDISSLTRAMREVVDLVDTRVLDIGDATVVNHVNEVMVNATGQLLTEALKDAWLDMPVPDQAIAATHMISAVERSAFQLADTIGTARIVVKMNANVEMEIHVVDAENVMDMEFPKYGQSIGKWQGNSIKLPAGTVKDLETDGLTKVAFLLYNNLGEFLLPQQISSVTRAAGSTKLESDAEFEDGDGFAKAGNGMSMTTMMMIENATTVLPHKKIIKTIVNSKIISASVGNADVTPLNEPVIYTLKHLMTENVYSPVCAFWDFSEKSMTRQWSRIGCHMLGTNATHTTCSCSHLTNFAVLMDVYATPVSYTHSFALTALTYAGCVLSLVCLLAAFLTFLLCRSLQCDRNTIHKNLSLCLLVANLIFLTGIMQTSNKVVCAVIAGLLHYFFLAAFVWMLLEGVQLYFMLVQVFESERRRHAYFYLTGYGVPAIIVGVTAYKVPIAYGTKDFCWLAVDQGAIWAFVGPAVAILAMNMVMFAIAMFAMCRHKANSAAWHMKQKTRIESIRSWAKGAVVLVVLLGLTWSFGLLYINKHTIIFAYLFTILNSLQGVFIFSFHCLGNDKVQKEYKHCMRKAPCLPECLKVSYGTATPIAASPNQSADNSSNPLLRRISGLLSPKRHSTASGSQSVRLTDPKYVYQNVAIGDVYSSIKRLVPNNCSEPNPPEIATLPSTSTNNYLEPASDDHTYFEIDEMVYHEISYADGAIASSSNNNTYSRVRDAASRQTMSRTNTATLPIEPVINFDKYMIKPPAAAAGTTASLAPAPPSGSENDMDDKRHSGESAFCDGDGAVGNHDMGENESDDDKVKDVHTANMEDRDRVSNDSNYDSLRRQQNDTRRCLLDVNVSSSVVSDSLVNAAVTTTAASPSPNFVSDSTIGQ